MRILQLIAVCYFITPICFGQKTADRSFQFRAGIDYRVRGTMLTYDNPSPTNPNNIVVVHEDNYLRGFGFLYSLEKLLSDKWTLNFTHQFRLLRLNGTQGLEYPYFVGLDSKHSLVMDASLDLVRRFAVKRSFIKAGLGLGVSGIGSGYKMYRNVQDAFGMPGLIMRTNHFRYPFATTFFAWQRRKFQSHLRINYCWNFSGLTFCSFFQPQLGIQYRLFSF